MEKKGVSGTARNSGRPGPSLKLLLLLLALFGEFVGAEVIYEAGEAHSSFPAVATHRGSVDGRLAYLVYTQKNHRRPVQRCVLLHGYGVTQSRLNLGAKVAPTLKRISSRLNPHATFAAIYYGQAIIDELLAKSCESVFVPLQESNNTSIFEMTQRTEMFLRDDVCTFDSVRKPRIGCALVGHSKGGAVAFNIARRCMDQTSLLGEKGCRQLGKIYSAAGVIQGASAAATVLGAKLLFEKNDREGQSVFAAMNDWSGAFSRFLFNAGNALWDFQSDKSDETNPTWFDLSPLAPQENNRPLYLINDIVLEKKGWLVADFAASMTEYEFNGRMDDWLGCGTRAPMPSGTYEAVHFRAHETFCRVFGNAMGPIHSDILRPAFEEGARALHAVAEKYSNLDETGGSTAFLDRVLTWDRFQVGDGFADYELSLGSCLRGYGAPNSAVVSCQRLTNVNHQAAAGGAFEARRHIVEHLGQGLSRVW